MAYDAFAIAEEHQCSLFLWDAHRAMVAAGETIDGRVSEDDGEFEFRYGASEHRKINRPARRYAPENLSVANYKSALNSGAS